MKFSTCPKRRTNKGALDSTLEFLKSETPLLRSTPGKAASVRFMTNEAHFLTAGYLAFASDFLRHFGWTCYRLGNAGTNKYMSKFHAEESTQ